MNDEDFPPPPNLEDDCHNPMNENVSEKFASASECINRFEKKSSMKSCTSDSSFTRRSSLLRPDKELDRPINSNAINRHNSVLPSTDSYFVNKFSLDDSSRSESHSLKKSIAVNNLNNSVSLDLADVATMNRMELYTIDDIDYNQIPGYIKIPDNVPQWKKYQLETKNKEAINVYLKAKQEEEMEKRKYGDIPQWKKELLIKKEKQLIEQNNSNDSDDIKYGNLPQWKKDLLLKRRVSKE